CAKDRRRYSGYSSFSEYFEFW
nr:immunoglobulin heavy chain junction region [Macaca mulatta]MOW22998.1 immunoglobulin heavy chain junction region [Macaca mulatta]